MKRIFAIIFCMCGLLVSAPLLFAQSGHAVRAVLVDATSGEPVGYATISLTISGGSKPLKYALSNDEGKVNLESVRNGSYNFKAELLGYEPYSKDINVRNGDVDLGEIKMTVDNFQLDAATISAAGNPVIIKKDTIEYNASSFQTSESDVLEDLLKKLPGVEVSASGQITVNGETISRITVDGKTFFLNDPQVASKNIPAKLVNKLKVIKKKSEQAEFTGIDDGNEENIIDLSVQPGMMRGLFGQVTAGAGHDVPTDDQTTGSTRFATNTFLGRFSDKTQISLILGGNNANNAGAGDFAGGMMGGMMGGGFGGGRGGGGMMGAFGGGSGITTSYNAGANVAGNFFDNRMELGGNYMYYGSTNELLQSSDNITYVSDSEHLYTGSDGIRNSNTNNHSFGLRLEHEFSENTSIFFEPSITIGNGGSTSQNNSSTSTLNPLTGLKTLTNASSSLNSNFSNSIQAGGSLLFRQRLGIPGRTLTVMTNLNYSNIDMDGINNSSTSIFHGGIAQVNDINQNYTQTSRTTNISTNVTYTEPLGNFFYAQAEYTYSWMRSESEKYTYEADGTLVPAYTNSIINESGRHSAGVNVLFQNSKVHAQVGFSIQPNKNRNYTQTGASYQVDTTIRMLNWSPQAMIILSPNDFANIRINYRGNSGQPSTSQLISVPDNSNPLSMSFGNPNLSPFFSHNFGVTFRHTNRMTFSSYNVSLNGGFVQNPIVNSSWYTNGISYTMPMNGPTTLNGGVNAMINSPIARSDFSIFNMVSGNYSQAASYVGANINTPQYVDADGALDYARFFTDYDRGLLDFTENSTKTVSANERFRLMYRPDNLELSLNAGTNFRKSWYSISSMADQTTTWNNSVGASIDWSFSLTGMRLRADYNYNWYRGYTTPQPDEHILNASIEKLLFNNTVTLTLSANDILGQSKNLMVNDTANYHTESTNNTLGRYIMVSLSYRFGTFGRRGAGRGGNGGGMGGGFGGGRGGGRGMRM